MVRGRDSTFEKRCSRRATPQRYTAPFAASHTFRPQHLREAEKMHDPKLIENAPVEQAVALRPLPRPEPLVRGAARPLFLRWLCLATASALVIAALAVAGFARGVSGAPLAVTLVILAATTAVGTLAGVLHWRADDLLRSGREAELERLRHDAHIVFYAVAL